MTKKFMPVLLMAAAALAITGCRTAPGPTYALSIRNKPSTEDINRADACRKCLPTLLSLSSNQMRVEPGPGFTSLTLSDVQAGAVDSPLVSALAGFNANLPNNPVHIEVK